MTIPCPSCTRGTGDGLLCSQCTDRLVKDLEQLPKLMRDLQVTYTRQSQAGTGNGGRGDTPVPFDGRASEVAAQVVNMVGTWIRDLDQGDLGKRVARCTCRPYLACPGWVDVPLAPSMQAWCGWLAEHLQRIRGHQAVKEIDLDIAAAVRAINRAVDSRAERKFCGFCVAEPEGKPCTRQLWAKPGKSYVICPCGTSYDVQASREKLLRDAEDQLASAAAILTAVPDAYGVLLNTNTFHSWVTRGRLLSKGTRGSVAVYRVGDALALARTAATRRKAG